MQEIKKNPLKKGLAHKYCLILEPKDSRDALLGKIVLMKGNFGIMRLMTFR